MVESKELMEKLEKTGRKKNGIFMNPQGKYTQRKPLKNRNKIES